MDKIFPNILFYDISLWIISRIEYIMLNADCNWHLLFCEPCIVFVFFIVFNSFFLEMENRIVSTEEPAEQNYCTNVKADECSSACTFHHNFFSNCWQNFVRAFSVLLIFYVSVNILWLSSEKIASWILWSI